MNKLLQKLDSKKLGYLYRFLISAAIVVALALGCWGFVASVFASSTASYQKMDEGWDVVINDSLYEGVNLSTFRVPDNVTKGDVLILKNNLPDRLDSKVSSMTLLMYLSAIDVRIDGQSIYSYGEEAYEAGFVGSGYHFIQLPYGAENKEITIILKPAETGAFTNIVAPAIVPTEYAPSSFADRNMRNVFVCIFIFMLGAMITIISSISLFFDSKSGRLTVIGVLATLVGAWALCNTKVLQLFSVDLELNTSLEYITLYVAPIPLMALLIMVRQDVTRWRKNTLIAGMAMILLFDVISTILHFTGVAHYPSTLATFHFLAFAVIVIAAVAGWKRFRDMNKAEKVLNIAILTLCAFAGVDIVRFNLSKYLWPENETLTDSILPIGMLIFIVLLVASYFWSLFEMIEMNAESAALEAMAYNDSLTGLYNRAKAEKKFAKLMEEEKDYFLINMDLNGLKRMNDKFGHEKGDLLIITFADILKTCFNDIGTIIRMGGDEFLVIIEAEHESEIKPALTNMIKLEAAKTEETGMRIDTAFGLSSNIEDRSRNPEQVYSIADSRMYMMKKKSKAARKN
ncbi:MAG: GGDEF domain-containing protein [Lachnospiraceae bacterium]|nr:GGDEF domain-containing protein [Lachnospiraceae bacterium]